MTRLFVGAPLGSASGHNEARRTRPSATGSVLRPLAAEVRRHGRAPGAGLPAPEARPWLRLGSASGHKNVLQLVPEDIHWKTRLDHSAKRVYSIRDSQLKAGMP